MINLAQPDGQRYRTKAELVYSTLRSAIMRCQLAPGERLIIDEISQQLGVSHIPVREAINQLQSDRLVDVIPHAGATVAPISPEDVSEIFTLMEGLEYVALRIAAEQTSSDRLGSLNQLLTRLDGARDRKDDEAWAELNIAFHREIASISNMPMLSEMTNRVLDRWDRVRRHVRVLPGRLSEAQAQHHDIVTAIERHDVSTAQALATLHNRGALGAYQMSFARHAYTDGVKEERS